MVDRTADRMAVTKVAKRALGMVAKKVVEMVGSSVDSMAVK